jgi:ATP-binding cassette subfamily B protein
MKNKTARILDSLSTRIKLLRSNLNLLGTLKLVWSVEKKWTVYNLSLILIETAVFFFSMYWLKILIDSISNAGGRLGDHREDILVNIFIAGVAAMVYACVRALSAYVTEKQSARVAERFDDKIHECATKLDISFYESPAYFDILKRAKDAGSDRPALFIKTLSEILKNTLTFLAMGAILVTIDWKLIPMLFVFVLPILMVRLAFADALNVWRMKQTPVEREAAYLGDLITSPAAAKEIRSYRLGHYFRSLYLKIRLTLLSQKLTLSLKRTKNEIVTTAMATAGFFACIAYIALQALQGKTTIGDITLFLVIFPQSFSTMQNLAAGISIVYQNNIYINSIFDLFKLKSNLRDTSSGPVLPSSALAVEFKQVSFTYPHCTGPALSGINLKIPAGKIIGLAGVNGAGKTTLIKLLARLYDVSGGQILLGGTDIRDLSLDEYRKQIGIVYQDFVKYNFSATDNIRFGAIDSPFSGEAMMEASRRAGAHEFIDNFPEGYQSRMGRLFGEGKEISIGQWQKLAIARAFYSQSPILVFDEATSALDPGAEKALFDHFRQTTAHRSALIISHRYSALRHADYVYVLEGGRIKQAGTPAELMEKDGIYQRLFKEPALEKEDLVTY